MQQRNLEIVILGLSITSAWGNGHAVTYRGLMRELCARGHRVLFLERDVPWYAENRDLPAPPYGVTALYRDLEDLRERFGDAIRRADLVIIGSYVPDGIEIARYVLEHARGLRAFYDIDTPVTLGKLARGEDDYLARDTIPRFDLYLSFTGGPTLRRLEVEYGAACARALYCSADTQVYRPMQMERRWALGYLGTYSTDRQPRLHRLLVEPAQQHPELAFVVAGAQYPEDLRWPGNVERIQHVTPAGHPEFYARQRITLNVTRDDMIRAGWSPSIRLFEAGACGAPVVSDTWPGLEEFFTPGREILVAETADDVAAILRDRSAKELEAIGAAARRRVLESHTAARRAIELEAHIGERLARRVVRPTVQAGT